MDGEELCILPSSFQSGVHGGQYGTVCEFLLVFGALISAPWGATLRAFKGAFKGCVFSTAGCPGLPLSTNGHYVPGTTLRPGTQR